MKTNAKRIKALGRKYAKQAFRLTEDDFVELSMLERAYLNGYKRCLKELQETGAKLDITATLTGHDPYEIRR